MKRLRLWVLFVFTIKVMTSVSQFCQMCWLYVHTHLFPELERTRSWTCSPHRTSAPRKPFLWSLQDPSDPRCGWCSCRAASRLTSGSSWEETGYLETELQRGSTQVTTQPGESEALNSHVMSVTWSVWAWRSVMSRRIELRTDLWALELNSQSGGV